MRFLILDDHPVVAFGLHHIIKSYGLGDTTHVSDAFGFKQQLSHCTFDLVILDLNIPGSSFESNFQLIKKLQPLAKILVFSSYYAPDLLKTLTQLGMNGFLAKTAHPEEIVQGIEKTVGGQFFMGSQINTGSSISDHEGTPAYQDDDFIKRLGLSKREEEILRLITHGKTSQVIGDQLFISKYTVETHRKNILRKLDFNSSAELVRFAVQQGIV